MNSGKILETRFLGRFSVCSLDVWYYCCIYDVHVSPIMLCTCGVVYIWCFLLVFYAMLSIDGIVYRWSCVHIGYAVFCTYGVVRMLDMRRCVHMELCAFSYAVLCTYGMVCILYIWCYVWCCVYDYTCGVLCMWCHVHVIHRVLCARGVVYMSCMGCCVHVVHVVL